MFGWLMLAQYVGAIVWAKLATPLTWAGTQSSTHPHVVTAIVLGGLIAIPTFLLTVFKPSAPVTPWVVSVCQMLFSALLIEVSGGRIETHFHVFGSLAFLAFYRDWRLLVPATLVVVVDHFVRGIYSPVTVYGISSGAQFRFLEHSAWVLFEDVFLTISCLRGRSDMKVTAQRQFELESKNAELNAANELATIANLAKTTFLSRTSHELRTPMNAILGFGQLLGMTDLDEKQRDSLSYIMKGGQHLLGLINDVLDISKIEAGALGLTLEPVNVNLVLTAVANLTKPDADQKGVGLSIEEEGELIVLADRQRLIQSIFNLVTNSIKFNKPGGSVWLRCIPVGSENVEISVEDTGEGISEADKAKLFVPFERLDADAKGIEGTGLGLVLTKTHLEAMDGKIFVESEVGKGTCFRVLMRQYRADDPCAADPAA